MSTGLIDGAMDYLADCTHIVDSGTDGIWKYHKYSDGTYHAWYEGLAGWATGSAWGGGYFHKGTGAAPPSFSKSVTAETGVKTDANLAMFCGANLSTLEPYWWTGSASSTSNASVRLDLYGTW